MKSRRRLPRIGSVVLAAALVGCGTAGCGPAGSSDAEQACATDKAFALEAGHYADVGKPGAAKGDGRPFVVVLDEQHALRTGQVELAIVLNRLHQTAGLRHLALEGSVVERPEPDLGWFTALPDPGVRRQVALRLLAEGEVSAAEFAAMVLPDFRLHAVEQEQDYRVGLSDEAERSYTGYLTAIAAMTMTAEQLGTANDLLDQEKHEEAIRFIIDADPWTSERDRILNRKVPVVTTAEMRDLGAELEAKAREVGADVARYREDFRSAQAFFDTSTRRSTTMAERTAALATELVGECAPIAMNIGAAHTSEVADSFGARNVPYAVVSPLSLSSEDRNGSLTAEQFERKVKEQSVDPVGGVGALLDGRRKPRPAGTQDWFKGKAQLAYATAVIAEAADAAGGGGEPPFGLDRTALGLGGSGPDAPRIDIDLSTIRLLPVDDRNDVVFKAVLLEDNTELWVRTAVVNATPEFHPDDPRTLEQALKQILGELKRATPAEAAPPGTQPQVFAVTGRVSAAVASSSTAIESTSLTG